MPLVFLCKELTVMTTKNNHTVKGLPHSVYINTADQNLSQCLRICGSIKAAFNISDYGTSRDRMNSEY
jgi:hypothetical protein